MLTTRQAKEILRNLSVLPPERISEAQNFIIFLKEHYGIKQEVDESDIWTDNDIHDLMTAALKHADQSLG